MRRLINLILLALLAAVFVPVAEAREYGEHPERAAKRLVVTDGKKLNVRRQPTTKAALRTQLRPGDIIYVTDETLYDGDGYQWLKLTDKWGSRIPSDGYVTTLNRFREEDNPKYDPPSDEQLKLENAVDISQSAVRWILLIAAILFAAFYLISYFKKNPGEKILGESHNGMRRTFFFNLAPYRTVVVITLLLLAAAASSVALMLLLGALGFGILWLVKILCYVLMWVGILACIVGIICCIGGQWSWILAVFLGGGIWYFSDELTRFGDSCARTGLAFFHQFNILGYAYDLLLQYWQPVVVITCIPLAIFLCMALIWMLAAGALIVFEKIVTSRYNIKHPCPHCHQPSEPAVYLSLGPEGYESLPNGISLRPGFYGLLHIKNPVTGEKMPTMMMNGRDRLTRKCGNCQRLIKAEEGTEKHLAVAGSAMSGKSTLTYRMIAEIFSRVGEKGVNFTDVDFTIRDSSMIDKVKSIADKNVIDEEDMPDKTSTDDVASTQLMIQRNHSSIPYRLFINDVAGELFDGKNSTGPYSTRYFRNVDSVLLIIDPLTTDLSNFQPSGEYNAWLEKHDTEKVNKLPLENIMTTITNQFTMYGRDYKDVHLNIVLTKSDLGYIPPQVALNSQESLLDYLEKQMGLGRLLHWSRKFASCTVLVVAATAKGDASNISSVVDAVIVKQLGIKL